LPVRAGSLPTRVCAAACPPCLQVAARSLRDAGGDRGVAALQRAARERQLHVPAPVGGSPGGGVFERLLSLLRGFRPEPAPVQDSPDRVRAEGQDSASRGIRRRQGSATCRDVRAFGMDLLPPPWMEMVVMRGGMSAAGDANGP